MLLYVKREEYMIPDNTKEYMNSQILGSKNPKQLVLQTYTSTQFAKPETEIIWSAHIAMHLKQTETSKRENSQHMGNIQTKAVSRTQSEAMREHCGQLPLSNSEQRLVLR